MDAAQNLQLILTFIAAIMASITVLMAVWVAVWRTMAGWKLYKKTIKEMQDSIPSILDSKTSFLHSGEEWFDTLPESHFYKKWVIELRKKHTASLNSSLDLWNKASQDRTEILAEYSGVHAFSKFQNLWNPLRKRGRRRYISSVREKLVSARNLAASVDLLKKNPDEIPEYVKVLWNKAYQDMKDADITETLEYDSVKIRFLRKDLLLCVSHEDFEMIAPQEWEIYEVDGVNRLLWPAQRK